MNTCHICNENVSNLPIRLEQFPFDEKAAYIESVLDVLLESRYGPAYSYAYLDRPDGRTADEPMSFLDLILDERMPWYAAADRGLKSWQHLFEFGVRKNVHAKTEKDAKERQRNFQGLNLAALTSNLSPSNLGRGSPQIPRDSSIAVRFSKRCAVLPKGPGL